jgi:Na+-translocating membrane potential-generating system (MpsC)
MEGSAGPAGEMRAGQLNAAIANQIGKLTADFTGRGSEKSRAFIAGDVVVCLLENGATRGEQNIAAREGPARPPEHSSPRPSEPPVVTALVRVRVRAADARPARKARAVNTDGEGGGTVVCWDGRVRGLGAPRSRLDRASRSWAWAWAWG